MGCSPKQHAGFCHAHQRSRTVQKLNLDMLSLTEIVFAIAVALGASSPESII
jgi:hypothetical protein